MRARIKFSKTGNMKYVGHLDLMRFFQRAMRRADIPIKYSEGFSPHQIMSFAAPLGIGLESVGEYVDITIDDELQGDPETIRADAGKCRLLEEEYLSRLSAVMCPGVEVTKLRFIPDDAGKAMSSVGSAGYRVEFPDDDECDSELKTAEDGAQVCSSCSAAAGGADGGREGDRCADAGTIGTGCKAGETKRLSAEEIIRAVNDFMSKSSCVMSTIVKKSGAEKDRDIRPLVYEMSYADGAIDMHISQGSVENLKPEPVLEALGIGAGGLRIVRTEMYDHEGRPLA